MKDSQAQMIAKDPPKLSIPITTYTFEVMLHYVLFSKNINKRFLRNIMKLFDILDTHVYEKDGYITCIIEATKTVSKMRYDGISNLSYIKNSLLQSPLEQKHILHVYQKADVFDKAEYENLSTMIKMYVDYAYLYQSRADIVSSFDTLINTRGKISTDAIQHLQQLLESLLSNMRRTDATRSETDDISVSSSPSKELKTELAKLYDSLTDPRNIFKTGIKELNRFLNGGLRRKGMVIVYGPTNSFKSGVLLYFALWTIQFNPGLKPKQIGKKLAVVIVTMENTRDEELERIHSIYTQGLVDVRKISKEAWLEQWEGIFPNLGNDIELHIIYRNPIDTTTLDIQASIEELEEDNNLEVMAVIIDHLGNIKARNRQSNTNDWRDTVQIAYELSSWAKDSNRALVTAMHTNSTIDDRIAEAVGAGKTNLVRMLGRHCIADAKYIDRAVDLSLYIYKEYSNIDGNWYLGFKFEKQRARRDRGSNVFYHRLENDITLMYDEGTEYIRSVPCIPGTENTIQMQQMAVNPVANNLAQNPFQQMSGRSFVPRVNPAMMQPPPQPVLNAPPTISYEVPQQYDTLPQIIPIEELQEQEEFTDSDFVRDDVVQSIEQISDEMQDNQDDENIENTDFADLDDIGDDIASDGGASDIEEKME